MNIVFTLEASIMGGKRDDFSIIIKKTRISIKFVTSNRKGKRIQLQQLLLPSDAPWG